jgi:hypothetical protein
MLSPIAIALKCSENDLLSCISFEMAKRVINSSSLLERDACLAFTSGGCRKTRTELANGTVINKETNCSYITTTTRTDSGTTTTSGSWTCTIDVSYTTKDGKPCTLYGQVISSQQKYAQGNGIPVWYNPDNPCGDASVYADFSHTIGWILVIVGLFIGISGIIWAWLANKYKVVGAFEGASTGIHMLAGAARY